MCLSALLGFTDKMEALVTLSLNSPPGHCRLPPPPRPSHSVTPTLLITKKTRKWRGCSSLLPRRTRLTRPARSQKVCLIGKNNFSVYYCTCAPCTGSVSSLQLPRVQVQPVPLYCMSFLSHPISCQSQAALSNKATKGQSKKKEKKVNSLWQLGRDLLHITTAVYSS